MEARSEPSSPTPARPVRAAVPAVATPGPVPPRAAFLAIALPVAKKDRQIFVAYSYRLYSTPDYRKVYERVGKAFDISFVFADERITDLHLLQKIANMILESKFSIFDISGWNPNVTLELGLAYGFREQAFITFDPSKTSTEDVPADLRGLDRLQYGNLTELEDKLRTLCVQEFSPLQVPDPVGPLRTRIRSTLSQAPGLRVTEIAKSLGISVGYAQFGVAEMMKNSELVSTGHKRGTRYRLP